MLARIAGRWTLRLVIAGVLGAATSIGIAWGIAMMPLPDGDGQTVRDGALRVGDRNWIAWRHERLSHGVVVAFAFRGFSIEERDGRVQVYTGMSSAGGWSPIRAPGRFVHVPRVHDGLERAADYLVGFPCACVWGGTRYGGAGCFVVERDPPGVIHTGWHLGRETLLSWDHESVLLPIAPVWSGLLANTAFYGGAWLALPFAQGPIRRVLRRRQGRCTRCGYDRTGLSQDSPCPECGGPSATGQ